MHVLIGKLLEYILPGRWTRSDQHLFARSYETCDYDVKIRIIAKLCDRPETLRSFLLASKSDAAMLDDALFLKLLLRQRGFPVPESSNLSTARLKAQFNQRRTPNAQAGSTQQAYSRGCQGRRYTFSGLPSGRYQVIVKSGKAPPEGLAVTSYQEGFPPEDLGSCSFQGPGDSPPVEGSCHVLTITTLHKDTASLSIELILSPWLCYPHFVRTLELFGPLPRGALEVVDPKWLEMDGLKSDQLIDLAVGRSREGHSLCICSRFMSAPGFNDISYCSHPDGFHYCTKLGEVKAEAQGDYDQCGVFRRCYVLANPRSFEWVPTTTDSVQSIQWRGAHLSHDLDRTPIFAARVSLPDDPFTVLPGRLIQGDAWPCFAVKGLRMTHETPFELLCYRIAP